MGITREENDMECETYESYDPHELEEIFKRRNPDIWETYTRVDLDNLTTIYGIRLYFLKGE